MAEDNTKKDRIESEYEHEMDETDVPTEHAGRMSTLGCSRYVSDP